ncbi:precorrin-2 C(20)-methyltransferase [uncultured Megamonas sp.]|uniref:precorrin-2 C(20)-methyltransferase n=1 Tax=uncultured Megamonas sp. TaxID=286140 RepID=UPI0025F36DDA|nr:precorrin-2 C(20)-methyltransferase [uncultured Megamonas sp.]
MAGTFYGIGVGPGDPELLTMKAIKAIEKADVLIAPKTEKKDGSVALSIAKPYLKDDIEIVYQVFPMVVNFETTDAWQKNKEEILALLQAGKNVVFLTLGDPMFYSTYIYVYRLLAKEKDINIETIPGVPAFCAIGSKLGYPLVEGNDIISVIPATADKETIDKALAVSNNVVMMKVYKNYPEVVDALAENDMIDNAVLVSRCGLPDEEIIDDLQAQKDKKLNYLSTILTRRSKGI